ncbi:SufD family Fe-S cluster assembly protein [Chlamydia sp.]|uniref:SufD family Fe-S cluster assembly protein n=1 Tax=Chlamydia sp. TaxID=35827 RepID=UPI0025B914B3|nr:SufD family Fe-S cluster assembly protein [Chlamydia sp.]MBQ8498818.1 SufD family Fe-S cluster assembly protein [Chlamydia sp.]
MWGTHQQKFICSDVRLSEMGRSLWEAYKHNRIFREVCSWLWDMTQSIGTWSHCFGGEEALVTIPERKEIECVLINGCFIPSLSNLPSGTIVAPLREARAFFQNSQSADPLEALHSFLRSEEGLVIYIPEGQEFTVSWMVRHYYICEEENYHKVCVPYIVFILGKGTAASIEMEILALPQHFHLFGQTLCFLGEEAELILTMRSLPKGVENILWSHHVEVERRGACAIVQEMDSMGKGWFRNHFLLKGEAAHGESLVKIHNGECLGVHNMMYHDAQATSSRQNIRSILEEGCFAFEGGIHISSKGNLSNAYQKHDTLLLSHHASARTFPRLEILTDDVKASHGATVGSLDAHLLAYLRSRGFSLMDAKKALQKSFLALGIENDYFRKLQKKGLSNV